MFGFLSARSTLLLEGRRCAESYTTYLLRQVRDQARPGQQYTITQPLGLLLAKEFSPLDNLHKGWNESIFLHGFVAACEDELKKRQMDGVTMKIHYPHWQLMNGPDHVPQALMQVEVIIKCWQLDKLQPVAEPARGSFPRLVQPGGKGTGC